jgi:hypothetical protein
MRYSFNLLDSSVYNRTFPVNWLHMAPIGAVREQEKGLEIRPAQFQFSMMAHCKVMFAGARERGISRHSAYIG